MKACNELGFRHVHGLGVRQDSHRANELFHKACNTGDMKACSNLARSYDGWVKDSISNSTKATAFYSIACDGGNMPTCTFLGHRYATGLKTRKNDEKARILFQKACNGGHDGGCQSLVWLAERTSKSRP